MVGAAGATVEIAVDSVRPAIIIALLEDNV
jgi:hypothetical protein